MRQQGRVVESNQYGKTLNIARDRVQIVVKIQKVETKCNKRTCLKFEQQFNSHADFTLI